MRRMVLVVPAVVVALAAGAVGALEVSSSRTFQPFGDLVARVPTSESVVALTFDDGPADARVEAILAPLREEGVRATFFVTGEGLAGSPSTGRRLVEAGHELGNHSYSHQRMVLKTPGFIQREIEETDRLIRAAGQTGPITFRPPYGKKLLLLPAYLARTGRTTVMWDLEPDSYADIAADADRIAAYVVERVRPGSIILLHVWPESRATGRQAIPLIVAGLKEQSYRFVTVSELLALR